MIFLLYVVGALLLLHGIYQFAKYVMVLSEIKKSKPLTNESQGLYKINVLVPVLHEEKTLEKLLSELSQQDYPKDHYGVYIITTEKEHITNIRPNTVDIIQKVLAEKKFPNLNLVHLHYPNREGFKAEQLNFALEQLSLEMGESGVKSTFFLCVDADATIAPHTLTLFNSVIEDDIEIYQQPSLRLKNVDKLKSPFMQSFAFLQSFFAISYELPMFIGKFFPWRLKYFVGSGLLIKGSFLSRIGGFPSVIEDVRLGRLSSFLNTTVKLVPGFGIVETAKSLPVYIKQSSVWFFGCGLFISDYVQARRLRDNTTQAGDYILVLYGFFKAFRWLNKGLFHLLGLIFAIYYGDTALFALFSISLLVNSVLPVMFVLKDFQDLWLKTSWMSQKRLVFNSIVFSPIMYALNFIGLYHGLLKLFKFYLWGQITLPKTER